MLLSLCIVCYVQPPSLELHRGDCRGSSLAKQASQAGADDAVPIAGMEKAQHLLPHPHIPSKTTMVLAVVMLHVVALAYLMLVLYRAARYDPHAAPLKGNKAWAHSSIITSLFIFLQKTGALQQFSNGTAFVCTVLGFPVPFCFMCVRIQVWTSALTCIPAQNR